MKNEVVLEELLQIQKKSSLNIENTNRAYELLMEDIGLENKMKYKYILDFNSDIGIRSFVDYLKKLDYESKAREIDGLINDIVYIGNTSYKTTRRGLELLVLLNNENFKKELLIKVLVSICDTTLNTSKDLINQTIVGAFRKLFFEPIDDNFYEKKYSLTNKNFSNIEKLFINSAFMEDFDKEKISVKTRLMILKWLGKFENESSLNGDEIKLINKFVLGLDSSFIDILRNDKDFEKKYGEFISEIKDAKKAEPTKALEGKKPIEILSYEDISNNLERINMSLLELEKRNNKNIVNSNFYKSENKKLTSEKEMLYDELRKDKVAIEKLTRSNRELMEKVDKLNSIIEEKDRLIAKNKENISEIMETNSKVENIELVQFKKKISNKLKMNFKNIVDLEQLGVSGDALEFISLNINGIIKILKENGIDI